METAALAMFCGFILWLLVQALRSSRRAQQELRRKRPDDVFDEGNCNGEWDEYEIENGRVN